MDDNMYFLAECENGPGLYYDWNSVCIEELEGALFNMHGAITDLRKFWQILLHSYSAAYELGCPVHNLENYDDILGAVQVREPVEAFWGVTLREVERRVIEMLNTRIPRDGGHTIWEWPSHRVYHHYIPRY